MNKLVFIFLLLTGTVASGQYIRVVDEDNKPIPDVAVYDENRSAFTYTSRGGRVAIAAFGSSGRICFHHFAYENMCLTPGEIKEMNYTVKLHRKVFVIDEFVVSASKWEQRADEVPNKISPVLKPVIDFHNPQTAADLLNLTGEVFIQKSQMGGGSPMIRGFATNRILIVVDGVRMNNAIYREGNIQNVISIDPAIIDRTEVIFGPGASIYGSDAIGGVMDFHTKRALVSTGEKLFIKADAFTRYSTANGEKTAHADFNVGGKKLALLAGVTVSEFGDQRMGNPDYDSYLRPEYIRRINDKDSIFVNSDPRLQVYSGYNQINTTGKIRFRASDNFNLTLSNHWSKLSDVPRYDRLIVYRSGKLRFAEWYYGPQEWMMTSAEASWKRESGPFDNLKIITAHQFYRESRHDRARNNLIRNSQEEKLQIFSLNIDADKTTNGKKLLYYGAEWVLNDINSVAWTTDISSGMTAPAGPRYPDGTNRFSSYSLYGGYKNPVSESFTLNAGLRYNYVTLSSTIEDNSWYSFPFTTISISNGALTGSVGIVKKITEQADITANLSTGFRAPNLDDAGKVFESTPGVVVVPNPGLRPEYAWNADIGISNNFGRFLHAEVNGFVTLLDNAMVRRDFTFSGEDSIVYRGQLSKVEAVVNAGSGIVYGVQLNILANLTRDLKLKSALNITDGYDQDDIPLRHVAPLFGSTHLTFERPRFKTEIYTIYNGSKPYKRMAPSEAEKPYMYAEDENGNPFSPAWFTLNAKVSYNFSRWGVINAGVENILDHGYRPYSSGIVAPGRNFILSLRVTV